MARASANEGAGGSGMAAAMARVWARRQEGRAGAGGSGGEERANAGGVQGQTGGSARLTTNEALGGAIEISSGSEEWPDARDSDEDSDSSVGRLNDMPAANHEVPHVNVEVSSDSDSDTVEEGEEVVAGRPGAPYGGFGRCFKCDRLGHW